MGSGPHTRPVGRGQARLARVSAGEACIAPTDGLLGSESELMRAAQRSTTRFRELINRPELLVMPGGFSPFLARMAEVAGFESFFLAGSQTAAYLYGLPDVGIM